MNRFEAVCFSVDGTLYPKWMMNLCLMKTVYPSPLLAYRYSRFRSSMRSHPEILTDPPNREGFLQRQAISILRSSKKAIDQSAITGINEQIKRQFHSVWSNPRLKLTPFPYVRETFLAIRSMGLKIGILSDFPLGTKLQLMGIDDLIDVAICSEESGYLKPHPAPFELICSRLEVQGTSILYVGDSYPKDILGAAGVGMTTCLVYAPGRNPNRKKQAMEKYPEADTICSGYKELLDWWIKVQNGGV